MFADFLGHPNWQWMGLLILAGIGYAVVSLLKAAGGAASSPLGQGLLSAWLKK
jgi:hypothetical protein